MDVTLKLDRQRLDYIVSVLAQRPYAEVAETITAIAQQVQQSMAPEVVLPTQLTPPAKGHVNGSAPRRKRAIRAASHQPSESTGVPS